MSAYVRLSAKRVRRHSKWLSAKNCHDRTFVSFAAKINKKTKAVTYVYVVFVVFKDFVVSRLLTIDY